VGLNFFSLFYGMKQFSTGWCHLVSERLYWLGNPVLNGVSNNFFCPHCLYFGSRACYLSPPADSFRCLHHFCMCRALQVRRFVGFRSDLFSSLLFDQFISFNILVALVLSCFFRSVLLGLFV